MLYQTEKLEKSVVTSKGCNTHHNGLGVVVVVVGGGRMITIGGHAVNVLMAAVTRKREVTFTGGVVKTKRFIEIHPH